MTENKSIRIKGYAKINLHLDVTGRMNGGYHRVETVMQTVSLHDEIELSVAATDGFSVSCNVEGIPLDGRNLAVRAASLFCEATGISPRMHIVIHKQIPMAAGMAGGSTDGAAVLLGMNRLYGNPLSIEELCALGGRLGADVPFCLLGGTSLAEGKGDALHSFPPMPDCHLVIACEGEGVSTPWAYGLLDSLYENFEGARMPKGVEILKEAMQGGELSQIAHSLYNIFEEPVLAQRPVAAELREIFLRKGALGAMMSGSGPSVFGIFETEAGARGAMLALMERGYRPYLCHPVGKRTENLGWFGKTPKNEECIDNLIVEKNY